MWEIFAHAFYSDAYLAVLVPLHRPPCCVCGAHRPIHQPLPRVDVDLALALLRLPSLSSHSAASPRRHPEGYGFGPEARNALDEVPSRLQMQLPPLMHFAPQPTVGPAVSGLLSLQL